jgi:hypothetical protein
LDIHAGILDTFDLSHKFDSILKFKAAIFGALLLDNLWGWNELIKIFIAGKDLDINLITDLDLFNGVIMV